MDPTQQPGHDEMTGRIAAPTTNRRKTALVALLAAALAAGATAALFTTGENSAAANVAIIADPAPPAGAVDLAAADNDPAHAPTDPGSGLENGDAAPAGGLVGDWSTEGSTIVDARGVPVQIRGVNWFGFDTQAGVPHGLWSRNAEDMIDQIADLGFNTIRLPFSAAMLDGSVTPNGINEQQNPDLAGLSSLEVMDRIIEYAGTKGLAVILDRHALGPDNRHHLWYDDTFGPGRLTADWELLATRYANHENVIGADLYNEPHDEACWGCGDPALDWKLAAEETGNALHAIDPGWLLFIEGVEHADGANCDNPETTGCTWWGGDLSDAIDEPIEINESDKVVYSPHEYATSVHRQDWFDDPSFPANMEPIWDQFWGQLETTNAAPVMVGEFGTTLDSEIDQVWLGELLAYMDRIGAGFTFWSFNPNSGDTGGILEDDWVTVDQDKMAYLEPYLLGPFAPVGG